MIPRLIPVFPLPNVVLFPGVFLPLHIFEPRYRTMVRDAINGDRIIGMVLLRPGARDDEGRPPVYPIGCAGLITHVERLTDGRYNIILRGLEKFRIVGEQHDRAYRLAEIDPLAEVCEEQERQIVRRERQKLEGLVRLAEHGSAEPRLASTVGDEDLVNALAQYLDFEPVERQALLECDGILARCRSLIELLEMKVIVSKAPPGSAALH